MSGIDLRQRIRDAIRNPANLPGLDATVERVMDALIGAGVGTDPRTLGGAIVGPGGPYDEDAVLFDTRNAVILEACEVAILGAIRKGVLDEKPITGLVLRGRINKTSDRVQALYLMNEDGAAGIVTELIGVASRAGWGVEFTDRVKERMEEMPL